MSGRLIGGPEHGRPIPAGDAYWWAFAAPRVSFRLGDEFNAMSAIPLEVRRGEYREVRNGMYVWCGWVTSHREPKEYATRHRLDDSIDPEWAEEEFRADVERKAAEIYHAVAWETLIEEVVTSHELERPTYEPIYETRWLWRRWRWKSTQVGERMLQSFDFVQYRVLRVFSYPKEF